MPRILCSICGAGPAYEDGAAALFADGRDEKGRPLRFCAEGLPLTAVQAWLDRQLRVGPLLEPGVVAVFAQRLAEGPR